MKLSEDLKSDELLHDEDLFTRIMREVAKEYIEISKYVHLINLIRWYGMFRNEGKYNLRCLKKTLVLIDVHQMKRSELKK